MATEPGLWEPGKGIAPELGTLRHFVQLMQTADAADLPAALSEEEAEAHAPLMKQPNEAWAVAESLGDDEIETLIRFFTLAEQQLPGWDGGKQSPVIPLVKILRGRDAFGEALRKWIKANTDNRFLPYGSAL